eukprot:TRINITY_DN965_c0_g1_i1.p1 TRINITY_DN965_c0_g1~~TRINITY_DN965_c0_g1_i1.p1  ORF type:complete len:466 (-),score=139.92 TRINITY_DN965_c0_g1_i1:1476-2744(-)
MDHLTALIVLGSAAAVLLLLTLVCLLSWLLRRSDNAALQEARQRAGVEMLYVTSGYSIAYRYTVPADPSRSRRFPVCIPNGLAATMVTTGKIHDTLVADGFAVLSYDRVGVGFSESDAGVPTVDATMRDMDEVMEAVAPDSKWLLLGPSMGSVVAQCYMLRHPQKCVGFLNMDGFPAPFSAKREKFAGAAAPYKLFSALASAGIMRPFLFLARGTFGATATNMFPVNVITAQMNQSKFWSNTAKEFMLMLDLATESTQGWGSLDVLRMGNERQLELARLPPANNGTFDEFEKSWQKLPDRSSAEYGADWLSASETASLTEELHPLVEESRLATILASMPVRVMSARDYNYFGGDSFYDQDMKLWAAAEHGLHILVCRRGKRYVFPTESHMTLFQRNYAISKCMCEIEQELNHDDERSSVDVL